MKLRTSIGLAALLATVTSLGQAQMLGTLTVNPAIAKVGEPVTITATVDVVSGNYCGYAVFFGDGTDKDGVSDISHASPFVFQHSYAKPGTYTINLGGRHVQSHPNCGGADKTATVKVEGTAAPVATAAPTAKPTPASLCPSPWKLVSKSHNAKTGAYACSAKPGTALPNPKPSCPGDLTYSENVRKGQFSCKP